MSTAYPKEPSTPKAAAAPTGDGIDKKQTTQQNKALPPAAPTSAEDIKANDGSRRTSVVGKRFNIDDLNRTATSGCPKCCHCSKCCASPKCCSCLRPGSTMGFLCQKENILIILTILGVICGVILGFSLKLYKENTTACLKDMKARKNMTTDDVPGSCKWESSDRLYVRFVGELFLNCLKSLILPLIVSSLISAIGSLDLSLSRRIGFRAILYYFVTTLLAVILGIILVNLIEPGKGLDLGNATKEAAKNKFKGKDPAHTADTLLDLVRNMFPPNLIQATVQTYKTTRVKKDGTIDGSFTEGMNILGLVVFTVLLGIVISKLGYRGAPLLDFATSLGEATMIMVKCVIWFTPIGVLFLIASEFIGPKGDKLFQLMGALGFYFGTVMAGLMIHGGIFLPLIYFFCTKKLPFRFIGHMSQALFTAFGTSSSSATLPVTIKCLEDKNGVDPRVSRFVLPIGATMNMDGTALYEAVAALFIAQMQPDFELDFGKIIAISISATAASIGAAGIPQAGLVTMIMVLNTIGLDPGNVVYILPVDWLLDRFRTMINVLGDSFGAAIIYEMSKKELEALGPPPTFEDDDLQGQKSYQSVRSNFSRKNTSIVAVPGTSDVDMTEKNEAV